jgi:hypothetical protein
MHPFALTFGGYVADCGYEFENRRRSENGIPRTGRFYDGCVDTMLNKTALCHNLC